MACGIPGNRFSLNVVWSQFSWRWVARCIRSENEEQVVNMNTPKILQVGNLQVGFRTDTGYVSAVNGISFDLHEGETLGIVGESGSGKSVLNLAVMGLIPQPPGKVESGEIVYRGQDLLSLSSNEMCRIRGNRIAMIFQDPMTALNPYLTIEDQLTEVTRWHLGIQMSEARNRAVEMLERVGIPNAPKRIQEYPHQFSGGMRQRVMIAMALSCKPDILIADEPTTALDVTIQAQILELMCQLQEDEGTAIILITHDLGVVAHNCHRVIVMYAGRAVEQAETEELFRDPRHPYTLGLLHSVLNVQGDPKARLQSISGQPPDLTELPPRCAFAPRCSYGDEECNQQVPILNRIKSEGTFREHRCLKEIGCLRDKGFRL